MTTFTHTLYYGLTWIATERRILCCCFHEVY